MNLVRNVFRVGCIALCVLGGSLTVRPVESAQAGDLAADFTKIRFYTAGELYGQAFDLAVRFQGRVDLKQVSLSPEQRQWAADNHFAIAGVIGELRHAEARIGVHGVVVTTRDAQGVDRSRFWLTNTCEVVEEEPEPQGIAAEARPFTPRSGAGQGGNGQKQSVEPEEP